MPPIHSPLLMFASASFRKAEKFLRLHLDRKAFEDHINKPCLGSVISCGKSQKKNSAH